MKRWLEWLYQNKLISSFFHTSVYCLKRELSDCSSVLDIGCGPDSPLKHCNVQYSVGVDAFKPYIISSKDKKIHNAYILADITTLDFEHNSFDAVILIGVLEHLTKEKGETLLEKVETCAKKKIIISCPNGYLPQSDTDQNPFQIHRSGIEVKEMKKRGYNAYGMAGLRFLRKENTTARLETEEAIFSTIRFHPKIFWMVISELTQAITYYFPTLAFEVFYVKKLNKKYLIKEGF